MTFSPSPDARAIQRAALRAAQGRRMGATFAIFAALSTALIWTPLDLDSLSSFAGCARATASRAVRTLARSGALDVRPGARGHSREVRIPPATPAPPTKRGEV